MIKAVIFDIDGVLVDSFAANVDFYQRLMVAAGYKKPPKTLFVGNIWRTMWDEIKYLTKSDNDTEIRRIWLLGHSVKAKKGLLKRTRGVKATIKLLAKKYKLAVVTNRTRHATKIVLDYLGLSSYFDAVVSFEDIKHHKPDPESLCLSLKKLKVLPAQAVFVGDSPSDAQAAIAAEVNFISFAKKPLIKNGASTQKFSELPRLLKKYEPV